MPLLKSGIYRRDAESANIVITLYICETPQVSDKSEGGKVLHEIY